MITNADLTLYNAYYNRETGITEYFRTHIRDVNWQTKNISKLSDKGMINASVANIYIPMTADFCFKTYVPPKTYAKLNPNVADKYFTFQEGDKVVKGIACFNVDVAKKGQTLKDLEREYDEVMNIMGITTWDKNLSHALAHYHLEAH